MHTKCTAILIDDEISNLKGLEQKLDKLFPNIEILEAFQKPEDAINYLNNNNEPDLVFLDIEMPRINGFELLSKLPKINFQIIFVTAYSEYAIEAFKQNAIDYVLKPIDDNDLIKAVDKAFERFKQQSKIENNQQLFDLLINNITKDNKLIVPTAKGLSFIPMNEVLHLEGYEGYTKIHLLNHTLITSSYNLGKFQKMLNDNFFKCHKSHIINMTKLRHFENEGYLVLQNEKRVPISRSNRKIFLERFKL